MATVNSASSPRTTPAKLFISYKRSIAEDETLAHAIHARMHEAGHETFIDVGLPVGSDWGAEIERGIDWCDYLIVLLSRHAVRSEMVQAEVRMAHQRRRRDNRPAILPIRVNNDDPYDYELEAYLGRILYLSWAGANDTDEIISKLQGRIASGTPDAFEPTLSVDQLKAPEAEEEEKFGRPSTARDPRPLMLPGGTLRDDDNYYVRRAADRQITALDKTTGQTVVIKAPRQMGKSSLITRHLTANREDGQKVAWIDFQSFSDAELTDFPALLKSLSNILLRQFRLEPKDDLEFTGQRDFTNFVEDEILAADPRISIGLDEVDRLLGRCYQADFFSMLRLWHNERAAPASLWEDVSLALVIATEPYLLIDAADRSPFNVTPPIEPEPFTRPELDELNLAYDRVLDQRDLDGLHDLLSGHPYLTRLAFYRLLSEPGLDFGTLDKTAADADGPFGEHLRSRLLLLESQENMLAAMRKLIAGRANLDDDTYFRLHGAGLADRRDNREVPANMLYARFFKQLK